MKILIENLAAIGVTTVKINETVGCALVRTNRCPVVAVVAADKILRI